MPQSDYLSQINCDKIIIIIIILSVLNFDLIILFDSNQKKKDVYVTDFLIYKFFYYCRKKFWDSFQDAWHRPALHEFGNSLLASSADKKWGYVENYVLLLLLLLLSLSLSLSLSPKCFTVDEFKPTN